MKIKIDSNIFEINEEMTILDACKSLDGVYIPSICYDEKLKNHGKCRLCIVEVDGELKLSCETLIRDGLNISTCSDRVIASRKATLELLLKEHSANCSECHKSGECKLQDAVFMHDISINNDLLVLEKDEFKQFTNGVLYNASKCISCGKCIALISNKQIPNPQNFMDNNLEIERIGDVVEVCPVGALKEGQ